jgi:hypothetical protein
LRGFDMAKFPAGKKNGTRTGNTTTGTNYGDNRSRN